MTPPPASGHHDAQWYRRVATKASAEPDTLPPGRVSDDAAWAAVSLMTAGILLYGGIGWVVGHFLGNQSLFIALGVLFGVVLAMFMLFRRLEPSQARARDAAAPTGDHRQPHGGRRTDARPDRPHRPDGVAPCPVAPCWPPTPAATSTPAAASPRRTRRSSTSTPIVEFDVAGLTFHLTKPMIMLWIAAAVVVIFFVLAFRKATIVPRGIQNIGEMGYLFVRDGIARDTIGKPRATRSSRCCSRSSSSSGCSTS